jgi:4-alpha-glucanotransferase
MPSTNTALHTLAEAAGVHRKWRDVAGRAQIVTDDSLVAVLTALGHPCHSRQQLASSLAAVKASGSDWAPLLVTEVDLPTQLGASASSAAVTDERGVTVRVSLQNGALPPLQVPGYYDVVHAGKAYRVAAAPKRCPLPTSASQRLWGAAVQIPALRGAQASTFGNFGDLAVAGQALGRRGCDALAINPVHALFPGVGDDFSPYSPSSRTFLNAALCDHGSFDATALPSPTSTSLIDWPTAMPQRLAQLRSGYANVTPETLARVKRYSEAEGSALRRHASFDALYVHFRERLGAKRWQEWPAQFHSPDNAAVAQFAKAHSSEVDFHLFAQWQAREGLELVQQNCKTAGMSIGLITDLAVGVHTGGSDSWAMHDAMLQGLTIGAPPDPLGPHGQNWSLTGFSPAGLRNSGYAPWIAMLRSALRSAGGMRIDHAFGLARLWVIPEGAQSSQGAYLDYPFLDLVRLVTLEAHRANALIVAEDLGTSPHGFTQAIADRQMLGMKVLWFERAADHGYIGARDYPVNCVAMTGTHDTATVAGWWSGRDLDWADTLDRFPADINRAKADDIRDWDRGLLWSTIGDGAQRPAASATQIAVDAAIAHIADTPACLAIVPVEDLLGEAEQANLPGTTHEHPNWRRRLAAPLEELLSSASVEKRLATLAGRKMPR